MTEVADQTLIAIYCKKLINNYDIKEQPWISPVVWEAIKKRKEINRKKRINAQNIMEEERLNNQYAVDSTALMQLRQTRRIFRETS